MATAGIGLTLARTVHYRDGENPVGTQQMCDVRTFQFVWAPAAIQAPIRARSSGVMPVRLPSGMSWLATA